MTDEWWVEAISIFIGSMSYDICCWWNKDKNNQITLLDIIPQYNKHMGGADFC